MFEIKKILVPTDFSDPSNLAVRYGFEMAQKLGASLTVLNIADDPILFANTTSDEYRSQAVTECQNQLKENVQQVIGKREGIELLCKCGSATAEIIDFAKAESINMIVMGSHGRSAMASMLLGNTAEHVVRHSPCPVMTVRSPEHNF